MPEIHLTENYCISCQSPITDGVLRCETCKLFPPLFSKMRFLWDYHDEKVNTFIYSMKYRPSAALCIFAGKIMAEATCRLFKYPEWDLIIPIPISNQSLQERLFNQCLLMAREIFNHKAINISKVTYTALRHKGYNAVQASLSHSERLRNMKKVFRADSNLVKHKRILLVDDVVTTGATTNYACRELLQSGAESVDVIALARSEMWNDFRSQFHPVPGKLFRNSSNREN
jgi:ComF family protein